jgi:hypothetical protein
VNGNEIAFVEDLDKLLSFIGESKRKPRAIKKITTSIWKKAITKLSTQTIL